MKGLEDYVTTIPNFPHEGVMFRDVTTIIQDGDGFRLAIDGLMEASKDWDFDCIGGSESRGFIFAAPLSYILGKGLIPFRKKGKLPREVYAQEYELEYGTAVIEVHKDAIKPGQRVLVVDDLVATGGTAEAMVKLIEKSGGIVAGIVTVIELKGLNGREHLAGYEMRALIQYDGI